MQLFNGLNMGMIKFYGLNFDNPLETWNGGNEGVDYDEKLKVINSNIDALKKEDENTDNDEKARNDLNELLTNSFNVKFVENLNGTQKDMLKDSIKNVLEAHKNEENFKKEYKWLINLATALGVEWYESTEESDRKHWINWDINNESVQLLKNWQATTWKFYENGKRVETAPEWVNRVWGTINDQLWKLAPLLGDNSSYKDNEWLKKANKLLNNIQEIIKNPIESNVQLLQQYIFDNLDDDMKDENDEKLKKTFMDKNKYNKSTEKFDWKFWETTLAGLNKVLEKTWKYIDSFKDQPSEWTEEEPLKNVKVKENFSIKWVSSVNAKDLIDGFDGLPDGAAEFKDGKWINLENKKPQEITVIVKIWDKTREITISARLDADNQQLILEEKQNTVWTPEISTTPMDTTPYVDDQGKKYQVLDNSQKLSQNTWLQWVTFYSPEVFSGQAPTNWKWETVALSKADENWDYPCLMKFSNGEVYNAKIDKKWNLCPTAINAVSNVPVVIENSTSGIAYIENKLPNALKGKGIQIWWNGQDYYIWLPSWGERLTIEPMTIDGKWIWTLTDSLAFLNFTNYLRNSWKMNDVEFKNNNPNLKLEWGELYVKVKKTRDVYWKKVKWLKVNKDIFWLPSDEKILNKYIKYNNRENWKKNWDKKEPNEDYKRVKISAPAVAVTPVTPPEAPVTPPEITGTPTVDFSDMLDTENLTDAQKARLNVILSNPRGLWHWGGEKFEFEGGLERTERGNNYIEVDVGDDKKVKIYEYHEGMTWLSYKRFVDGGKLSLFIWNYSKSGNYRWILVISNGGKYEWDWMNREPNWKWTQTWPNWNKFEWTFENWKPKSWRLILTQWWEEKEFTVERDGKWLKVISPGEMEGKYFNMKKWIFEDRPEETVENNFYGMSDVDFDAMNNSLKERMFIKKIWGNISYDLEKTKNYLESIKDTEWSALKATYWTPQWRAWISAVQILLNSMDWDNKIKVDGKIWPKTRKRVEEFQIKQWLKFRGGKPDGLPGKDTMKEILKVLSWSSSGWWWNDTDPGASGEIVTSPWIVDKLNQDIVNNLWLQEKTDINQDTKTSLNIPQNTVVYTKDGDENAYFYKSWNDIVRVFMNEPWIKKLISIPWEWGTINTDITTWTSKLDIFGWWRSRLESIFKSDVLKSLVWEDNFNNLSILISETDPKQYQLKNGEITVSLNDEIFMKDFCGVSKIEDKLNLVYLASELKSWKVSIVSRENAGENYLALSDQKFSVNLSNIKLEDFNSYCLNNLGFSLNIPSSH